MPTPFDIIDLGFVAAGTDRTARITETVEEARLADQLGYRAYLLGEHHDSWAAWSDPTEMLGLLASATTSIVIGTAAYLVKYHDPVALCKTLRPLEAACGGRLELGVCQSNSKGPAVAKQDFASAMAQIAALWPRPVWAYGRSAVGSKFLCGLSLFHIYPSGQPVSPEMVAEAQAAGQGVRLAVSVACARTSDEAIAMKEEVEQTGVQFKVNVFGTPDECLAGLAEVQARFKPDRLAISIAWHEPDVRRWAYTELARWD